MESFNEFAKLLSIILICIGGFAVGIGIIILAIKIVGQSAFGEKFDDWWDSKFSPF